jgi:hypothetical protein
MRFAAVVLWWEEWQLRILAISSLLLQWFLFFSAASRKFQIGGFLRFLIWMSYLAADALAIYALATLFNRHRQPASASSSNSHGLEVLWAPVLLIHLGGQDTITAYNIEDNELWTRHVTTMVSQVTVAVYVFFKSWSGEKRLLQAAIILFVAGILRCSEKPWALRRASINSLVRIPPAGTFLSAIREQRERRHKKMLSIAQRSSGVVSFLKPFFTRTLLSEVEKDDGEGEDEQGEGSPLTLQGYVQHATQFFAAHKEEGANTTTSITEQVDQNHREHHKKQEEELEKALPDLPTEPRKIFVDLVYPYARRLLILQSFFRLEGPYADRVLQAGLSNTFDLLYTKERVFQTDHGKLVRTAGMTLNFAALGLLSGSHKHDYYDKKDVIVTYILLAGTAALETFAFFRLMFLDNDIIPRSSRVLKDPPNNNPLSHFPDRVWKQVYEAIQTSLVARWIPSIIMRPLKENVYHRFKKWLGRARWSKTIAQYNLLDSFTRDTRPAVLSISARWFGCKDYLDQIQYVEHQSSSSGGITEVALAHVRRGWMEYIHDVATYKRFNSQKGRWTLEREQCYRQLRWSIRKPFDESVLLWHIATDLCFRQLGCQPGPDQGPRITRCREMSNYMIYLLFFQPEMLLAGTRRNLFTAACGDLEKLFGSDKPSLEDGVLSREIFDKAARAPPGTSIHNASRLGKTLLRFGDDDKMWKVMEGVWVEMLCYSASRCRGYLHAKSLGSGGEYLSYVWLLLSYMGMESLADRFQQPEDTEEEDDGEEGIVAAGPVTYQCQGTVDESEIYPV